MEFEDHHHQEEEEIELPPPSYDPLGNSTPRPATTMLTPAGTHAPPRKPRYRECLKNHAVGLGGQAIDGCGEFMQAGPDGTLDALKCAACSCHRNFHRKEPDAAAVYGGAVHPHHHLFYRSAPGYLHGPPQHHRPLALPSSSGGGGDDISDPTNMSAGGGVVSSKKRHRTKFTQEQKEKMVCLAEKLGWRIQKQDEGPIQQFCDETGVNRHVLKVWMHNNKHTLGKKP